MSGQLLSATVVFPMDRPPIRDGGLWLDQGVLQAVGTRAEVEALAPLQNPAERRHFPDSAILPGFVNAHTHLELSAMRGQIPPPAEGEDFTGWIRQLLAIRERWTEQDFVDSTREGVKALVKSGTTAVGDITASGLSFDPIQTSGLRGVCFRELLGFGADREKEAMETARAWIGAAAEGPTNRLRRGISPHAPHSTSPAVYRDAVRLAGEAGCLLTTHLAETPEELLFLRDGGGVFGRLLEARRHDMEGWTPPGVSPVRYLSEMGVFSTPGLAVHVNYANDEDLDLLAQSRAVPVFCPQSHRFFRHRDHPAARMLARGILLALGTDSLASSDSLEMLQEIRLAHAQFPQVPAVTWFACATIHGASALGLSAVAGSLTPGKAADLAVLSLPEEPLGAPGDDEALYQALLAPGTQVTATMIGGEWRYGPVDHQKRTHQKAQSWVTST